MSEWSFEGDQKCIVVQSMRDGIWPPVITGQHMMVCSERMREASSRVAPQERLIIPVPATYTFYECMLPGFLFVIKVPDSGCTAR